jgi:glutathione synthase/RimK-type ligase-like ATP-grasp enzyme
MNHSHLGVLVHFHSKENPPFTEKNFYSILSIYGEKRGFGVTVFTPPSILWDKKKVIGYRFHTKQGVWRKGIYPIPKLLYDRISYKSVSQMRSYHAMIKLLVTEHNSVLLGRGLPGKWKVYNMMKNENKLDEFLPKTIQYRPHLDLTQKLIEYPSLFFKPASGSNGKGVFKLSIEPTGCLIRGRSASNDPFTKQCTTFQECHFWIRQFIGSRSYVIQPYLELTTIDDQPFDIRILVQKNKDGEWLETGRAVRLGAKNGITSNLHGGGIAIKPSSFLQKYYSSEQISSIAEQTQLVVNHVPHILEKKHGDLLELGIDIGVDRDGRIWILEVNSKPGKKSLYLSKDRAAFIKSLVAPIEYSHFVVSKFGGSKLE